LITQYDKYELAWAAGFFDGEGYVGKLGTGAIVKVEQIDRRVLDRFQSAVQLGKVIKQKHTTSAGNPIFTFREGSFAGVQQCFVLLDKWLSPIKRTQFTEALRHAKQPNRMWQRCAQIGHDIRKQTRKPYRGRYCHTCRLAVAGRYYQRKKTRANES
jgi:hypothetical protein